MRSFVLYRNQWCGELNNAAVGQAFLESSYLEDIS
jgi:hypothetical protein